jgi:hypothetical protein
VAKYRITLIVDLYNKRTNIHRTAAKIELSLEDDGYTYTLEAFTSIFGGDVGEDVNMNDKFENVNIDNIVAATSEEDAGFKGGNDTEVAGRGNMNNEFENVNTDNIVAGASEEDASFKGGNDMEVVGTGTNGEKGTEEAGGSEEIGEMITVVAASGASGEKGM